MESNHEENTQLTSGEIGSLWKTYQSESLALCGVKYFLQHIEDTEIKALLDKKMALSNKRLNAVKDILHKEEHPIPEGLTERDVDLTAPRLFSDEWYLEYLLHSLQMEFYTYNQAMMTVVKLSLQQFYELVMKDTIKLEMEAKELSKKKGRFLREPTVPPIKHVNYVKKDSFLSGWFGNCRPLMAAEISQMVFSAKRNALGEAVITAFSQVAKNKDVREFFIKGREISSKHLKVFTDKLGEEYLSSASLIKTDQVTTSTESPFSDKLMTAFITTLIASAIGVYGISMSMSPRQDLGVMYTRLMAEIAAYSNDGANIMINHAWMERPPMAADRKSLAKKSHE